MASDETRHGASVGWTGTSEDLRAHRVRVGGVELAGSRAPDWGGDPAAADPEGARVVFEGEVGAEVVARLHEDAHARCFIANTVSCPVVIA